MEKQVDSLELFHLKVCMINSVDQIKGNLEIVEKRMKQASTRAHRDIADIKLIVVTKSRTTNMIRKAINAGAVFLGENYAEEGVAKKIEVGDEFNIEWHMIGHIQSRKARSVAMNFNMVHSLDSIKLAVKLDRFSMAVDKILPVLLEFNISGEDNKFGWMANNEDNWFELLPEIKEICKLQNLSVSGLMSMPPFVNDPELSRPHFKQLRRLHDFLKVEMPEVNWRELSMGTSVDYEVAIEEGATMVRIGQAILGKRNYKE